jgi:hypothetical protein
MNCTRCRNDYTEPGGLFFSPPENWDAVGTVRKRHLCPGCTKILEFLWDIPKEPIVNENFWGNGNDI